MEGEMRGRAGESARQNKRSAERKEGGGRKHSLCVCLQQLELVFGHERETATAKVRDD